MYNCLFQHTSKGRGFQKAVYQSQRSEKTQTLCRSDTSTGDLKTKKNSTVSKSVIQTHGLCRGGDGGFSTPSPPTFSQ